MQKLLRGRNLFSLEAWGGRKLLCLKRDSSPGDLVVLLEQLSAPCLEEDVFDCHRQGGSAYSRVGNLICSWVHSTFSYTFFVHAILPCHYSVVTLIFSITSIISITRWKIRLLRRSFGLFEFGEPYPELMTQHIYLSSIAFVFFHLQISPKNDRDVTDASSSLFLISIYEDSIFIFLSLHLSVNL